MSKRKRSPEYERLRDLLTYSRNQLANNLSREWLAKLEDSILKHGTTSFTLLSSPKLDEAGLWERTRDLLTEKGFHLRVCPHPSTPQGYFPSAVTLSLECLGANCSCADLVLPTDTEDDDDDEDTESPQ